MSTQVNSVRGVFGATHWERVAQEMAPPTSFSKGSEALAVAIDTVSLGRNSTSAGSILAGSAAAAKAATAVGGLVIAGGAMAFVGGATILKSSSEGLKKAYSHGDWEGGFCNLTRAAMGGAYSITGTGMVVAQSGAFASAATAATVGTAMFTGAGIAMYGAVGIYAGYGLAVDYHFRHEFNKISEDSNADLQKLGHALEWLKQQVSGKDATDLHRKWDRFSFRTSEACCRFIRETVTPEFLEKVRLGEDVEALALAQSIVREVRRDNRKQLAKNWLLMAITAIGITAMVLGIVFATGPFAPLLFAVAAALWLFIDSSKLHEKFCNFICGNSQIPAPSLLKKKEVAIVK